MVLLKINLKKKYKKTLRRDFPGRGTQVQSLVRELRSCKLPGGAKKKRERGRETTTNCSMFISIGSQFLIKKKRIKELLGNLNILDVE